MSLIDYPGIIAAVIFTQGCPFRCAYCHNPDLIRASDGTRTAYDDIVVKLRQHRKMLEGVCITGGEPTMQADLPEFIRAIKREGFLVKLDTNGVHPHMVEVLIQQQLVDYIAMDIKHLWEKYETVIRSGGSKTVENCRQTYELIQRSGVRHEFRTTACPGMHTEADLLQIGLALQPGERYAIQPVRYGTTLDSTLSVMPSLNVESVAEQLRELRPDMEVLVRT